MSHLSLCQYMWWGHVTSPWTADNIKVNSYHRSQLRNKYWRITTFLAKWNVSHYIIWRHLSVKFVFKYDRNTVVNILKKQGVPAPWVIIHLLYHLSHILRTREILIILICEFHSTLRLKIHFLWQKYSTEIKKTEWSWRHSFRITHEHDENGTSLNSWDKAHAFFEVNELVRPKAE